MKSMKAKTLDITFSNEVISTLYIIIIHIIRTHIVLVKYRKKSGYWCPTGV